MTSTFRRTGSATVLLTCIVALSLSLQACEDTKPADPVKDKADGTKPATDAKKAPAKPATDTKAKADMTGPLTVYSGRKEKLVGPVFSLFEKETGIKLRVKYGETQPLATALIKEGARSEADVFIAQDASTLGFLENKGQLAQLPKGVGTNIAEAFRGTSKFWVPITGRSRVIAYNTKLKTEDLPKTIDDLTDPKWKGRIGWPPENASFKSFVAAMIKLRGAEKTEAWLKGVQANDPKTYPKNTPAVRAVGKGEIDVALVNHYYLYRLRKELGDDFPVKNSYAKDGTAAALVNMSGAGIVKTTKKSALAAKFIEFLLSQKAQEHFAATNYEFPLVSGVKASIDLPPSAELNPPKIDLSALSDLEATEKILRSSGVSP